MSIIKQIILSFLLLFALISNAQLNKKIQLQWIDKAKIENSYSIDVQTLPLLDNKLFDINYIPYYFEQWEVTNVKVAKYKLTNIVYVTIDRNLFSDKSQHFFPDKIESSFIIKKARNVSYAQFKITPLVLINGELKRIVSFEIDYSFKQNTYRQKNIGSVHNSPLSSGEWFRFAIDTTGVYRINKSFLNSLGVNVNSINPKNIQIFGNGGERLPEANNVFRYDGLQENAIYIQGEGDDRFDDDDFILFYAQGPDVWIPKPFLNKAIHQKNIYSNVAYYYVHIGSTGKRIQNQIPVTGTIDKAITTFNDYAIHELEKINLDNFGQQFFGETFTINDIQNFQLPFTDIDLTKDIQVAFSVATVATTTTEFKLNYNSQNVITISSSPVSSLNIATFTTRSTNITPINDVLPFEVVFENLGNPAANAYLDFIEVNGSKKLIARNNQFSFRSFEIANSDASIVGEYIIENKDNVYQIWDVSEKTQPTIVNNTSTNTNFTFSVRGNELYEYVLLSGSNYYSPIQLNTKYVNNQNLHALKDIDYLVITKEELLGEASRLADYHKSKGLSTLVLTEQTIYNEFSSGQKDPIGIRDFIKHLYHNASTPDKRIKYVLMFGDTSYDFQNIEKHNNDINVIAYQSFDSKNLAHSYVTDDFFVMLDDNEGEFLVSNGVGDLIDVGIGRMPVKNREEAENSVDKALNYYSLQSFGKWRNHITFVADDVDRASSDFGLEKKVEQLADIVKNLKPVYNLTKVYADSYVQEISSGGNSYPKVKEAITNAVERGSLILDYFGHGGENGWASENILDISQIKAWDNKNTLPLFITITCEFSRFDNPTRVAGGEHVFSNTKGGATSMITTAREVYISFGGVFNIDLISDLLELNTTDNNTIAQSLAKTKNRYSGQKQRLFIQYFGDPAMHLAKPKASIKVTHMNDIDITQSTDVIKALSHVSFKGVVTDNNNDILPDFNGELSIIIYDKSVDKVTLNNDNQTDSSGNPTIMDFDVRDSKIFTGRASVVNGSWEFDFIAPRDIRIALGSAKLSFYAENQIIDKNGYNTDISIGGINYDAPEDTTGPTIKLFMNDASFIDGGNTNQDPLFLAELEDESGINTSFTAVDHDIVAILDNDQSNPIIMNDYYETELDNFKKGKVKFPFKNLSVGLHTITFKAWDTYNNPSESSINFVVVSDSELTLDNVLNYPNPFINYTEFWFNHNKPNESLEAQVQIFTVSGKLIKTINQTILTSGTLSRTIIWNGLDDFGNKIGKGVYIYKLKVKVISSGLKTEKIEKLVILQ